MRMWNKTVYELAVNASAILHSGYQDLVSNTSSSTTVDLDTTVTAVNAILDSVAEAISTTNVKALQALDSAVAATYSTESPLKVSKFLTALQVATLQNSNMGRLIADIATALASAVASPAGDLSTAVQLATALRDTYNSVALDDLVANTPFNWESFYDFGTDIFGRIWPSQSLGMSLDESAMLVVVMFESIRFVL